MFWKFIFLIVKVITAKFSTRGKDHFIFLSSKFIVNNRSCLRTKFYKKNHLLTNFFSTKKKFYG